MHDTARLEPLLTPREVAPLLGVSLSWLYRATQKGELPVLRVGSLLRFRRADVFHYLERRASLAGTTQEVQA